MQLPGTPIKPRRSRKGWYVLAGFIALVLAAPFLIGWVNTWLRNRALEAIIREIEADDPRWRWRDLIAEIDVLPDDQNSAKQIEKVDALMKKATFDLGPNWRDPKYNNARLRPDQIELLHAAFAKHDPQALVEARKLKDMPRGAFPIEDAETPFFKIRLDSAQATRSTFALLQHDAMRRSQEGDHAGAADSCQALLNASGSLMKQPFLIAFLIRCAGQAISVDTIERTLGHGELDDTTLTTLQTLLEREIADDAYGLALRGERAGCQQTYEMLSDGRMSISELTNGVGANAGAMDRLVDHFPGLLLGKYPEFLRTMNEQIRASKLKDAERSAALSKVVADVRSNRNILAMMLLPASEKVLEASDRTQASMRCTLAALAVERYRIKHGRWPDSLETVRQAGFLKAIPTDPYDGKPLRAKRVPTGFVVYSLGLDRIDNGGVINRSNPRTRNTDLGFELWDPPHHRGTPPPPEEEKGAGPPG